MGAVKSSCRSFEGLPLDLDGSKCGLGSTVVSEPLRFQACELTECDDGRHESWRQRFRTPETENGQFTLNDRATVSRSSAKGYKDQA